jgi:hypothetical protein
MLVSTTLTLYLVPVVYIVLDGLLARLRSRRGAPALEPAEVR